MGRGNRNPGCSCCDGCLSSSDSFDRADSTNVGANYTEVSGDWSISSNKLTTSDTAARIVYTGSAVHVDQVVSVKLDGAAGDKPGILTSWFDSSNYVFTEVELGTVTSTVRVWLTRSGTTTQLNEDTVTPGIWVGQEDTLTVCFYSPTGMLTWMTGTEQPRSMQQLWIDNPTQGTQWGLGTGDTNAGPVTFDDLSFERHRVF